MQIVSRLFHRLQSRTVINITAAILAFGIGILIRFISTPYIVSRLGTEAYGFVGVSANIIGIISLLTVSVNSLANRFIAVEYQSGRIDAAKSYYSSLIVSNVALSVVLLSLCVAISLNLEKIINIPGGMINEVKILFAILSANMIVLLLSSAWSVGAFLRNRLDVINWIQILGNIVQGVALILLFGLGLAHIWYVGVAIFAMGVVVSLGNYIAMRSLLPELRLELCLFSVKSVLNLSKAGAWNLVSKISDIFGQGLDLLIANVYLGATLAGVLAISKNVPFLVLGFFTALVSAFVPMLIKRYAEKSHSQFMLIMSRAIKVCCFFAALPMAFLIVFGEDFYSLWLQGQDSQLLNILTMVGAINLVFAMPIEIIWSVFTITNKLKWPTLFMLGNSILVFATMLLGCYMFENAFYKLLVVASARAGWGVIRSLTFLPLYGANVAHVPRRVFYKPIVVCIILLILNVSFGIAAKSIFEVQLWSGFVFAVLFFVSCSFISGYVFMRRNSILKLLPIMRSRKRMIHFVHRVDKMNPGDMASCPIRYFHWPLSCKEHDIENMDMRWIRENDVVIIGGGGLINCKDEWNRLINDILAKCKCVVAWGVGFNQHVNSTITATIDYNRFSILSIRDMDHPSGFEWLPCVSCMAISEEFISSEGKGIGVVSHCDNIMQREGESIVSSDGFNAIMRLIARHSVIKTNSYHAAYWAGLLGRDVLLEGVDYSEKFKWMSEIRLDSAKSMNKAFYERVMRLVGNDT